MDAGWRALVPRLVSGWLWQMGSTVRKVAGGRSQGISPSPVLLGWRWGLYLFLSPASARSVCVLVSTSAR